MEHYFFSTVQLKICTGMCNIFILSTLYRLLYSRQQIHRCLSCKHHASYHDVHFYPTIAVQIHSHDRDMIGVSYHRIVTHLWYSGDFFDTTIVVCSQGNVKEEHPLMHRTKSIATYVHRIINIRLQWRAIVDAERYIWYIRLSCTSLANMVPPYHPMHT